MKLLRSREQESLILGGIYAVTDRHIIGWAGDVHSKQPVTVELLLDGVVINSTTASQQVGAPDLNGGRCGWRFGMREVWQHISSNQNLEVRVAGGRPLCTRKGERHLSIRGPEPKDDGRLLNLLADGRIIDKFGRAIRPSASRRGWQKRVNDEFPRLRAELEGKFGYTPFLTYGLLLGYARERAPISFDHDCDVTYLSDKTRPEAVCDEFEGIVEHLAAVDDDWTVHPYKIVWHGRFSITPSWIGPQGLRMSFAYVSDDVRVTTDDIFPLQEVLMDRMQLLVPRRSELLAEFIYGTGWRWPDSGWVWEPRWKTRPEQLAAWLDNPTVDRFNNPRPRSRSLISPSQSSRSMP